MFLLSILLLVPTILATRREVQINNNYVVTFTSEFPNTIEGIEVNGYPSEELNLSGLSIENFTDNTFKNVSHIRVLNLSNNSLTELGDTLFVSLTNLEHLNLSYNSIDEMKKPFVHLRNLKILDLSVNSLRNLITGNFFGLTNLCVIFLKYNYIHTMSTELFENKSCRNHHLINAIPDIKPELLHHSKLSIKICINDTTLITVEHYNKGEKLASGCSKVRYRGDNFLKLSSLRIKKFQVGWYKLGDLSINHIDLSSNDITGLTSEMFNDLPESVSSVRLGSNKIKRLRKGIIVNEHLRFIDFQFNVIDEIKDDVFINTNLTILDLTFNKLNDTKFAATLPLTLKELYLHNNKITEISCESFSKLNKLEVLTLFSNKIMVIHRDSLRGLSGLKKLLLGDNGMQKIEAGSFQDLTELARLMLHYNDFVTLDSSGVFNGLKTVSYLDLARSNIMRIKKGAFENLGRLCQLVLSGNPIQKLENGTLHGLLQEEGCNVYLQDVPIEMIHGGVFARRNDSSNCLSESNNAQLKVL